MHHPWLFLNLLTREIHNRYVGSASGVFWLVLHPIILLGLYAFIFSTVFRVRLPGLETEGYVTFVAIGLWPWLAFQEAVQRGALALTGNAALIRKAAFPREMVVWAASGASFVVHLAGFALVLVVLHFFVTPLHWGALPMLLPLLAALVLLGLGLSLILSVIVTLFRDVEQALGPFLMIWFYASPILYPVAMVPKNLQPVLSLNPITYGVERARSLLMAGHWRPEPADALALLGGLGVFLAGWWFFRRVSASIEDFL
jgi:ABC-type polysaccharide/polyol phosphate export permease